MKKQSVSKGEPQVPLSGSIVDENVPRDVRTWLEKKGFGNVNVSQTNLKGSKDYILATHAAKNHLILITLDKGFGQLHRTFPKGTLTVLVIRAKPATPANIINILDLAQAKIDPKKLEGKLIILSKNRIRITS
jgi:predicted nuclease of predicted toxin-antitoxin system